MGAEIMLSSDLAGGGRKIHPEAKRVARK